MNYLLILSMPVTVRILSVR